MAKRRAAVKDIIYELDNDDIVLSSDDEGKEPKITRLEPESNNEEEITNEMNVVSCSDIIQIDCASDESDKMQVDHENRNGGKSTSAIELDESDGKPDNTSIEIVEVNNVSATLLNEDIIVDSPASNTDLGVVGCENRTPLITVRFKNTHLANTYKKTIKEFMLRLIKLRNEDVAESDNETDLELDIWPEDLVEDEILNEPVVEPDDSLFFIDTAPCNPSQIEIPKYSQLSSTIISGISPEKTKSPPPVFRRRQTCFNCDGEHSLRDCPLPRNHVKIAEKRKNMSVKVGRYHVEDEQKYGHLVPGRISGQLRHALGLKRSELPLHIYRMRVLGYPPGWLEEARISHSGITLFDSTGTATLDPEEEEGELCEPGSKDKFDIKKILDFPGFNVPASSRYAEEAYLLGLPPMSDQDSKMVMLQNLAPNAMKAYKRKKLTFFPSASQTALQGQAEMELDSGDEEAEFPSVPPLPDEEPPPIPPPPPVPPPPPTPSPETPAEEEKDDDLEVIEVMKVNEIPVPEDDLIVIDIDEDDSQASDNRDSPSLDYLEKRKMILLDALKGDSSEVDSITSAADNGKVPGDNSNKTAENDINIETKNTITGNKTRSSETVEIDIVTVEDKISKNIEMDLKIEKDKTMKAEQGKAIEAVKPHKNTMETDNSKELEVERSKIEADNLDQTSKISKEAQNPDKVEASVEVCDGLPKPENSADSIPNTEKQNSEIEEMKKEESMNEQDIKDLTRTPDSKTGQVKGTLYGTPVMNIASSYQKLPCDVNFSKDICDVINFENLPNSTGKYKKISGLLKKVKTEVDRIQES